MINSYQIFYMVGVFLKILKFHIRESSGSRMQVVKYNFKLKLKLPFFVVEISLFFLHFILHDISKLR